MRSKVTLLTALALIALTVTQCKKKTDEPVTEEPPVTAPSGPNSVADIIAANGSPTQSFTVSATSASTINANGGVIVEIPANAFETTSSGTITGNVTLQVRTIMSKSEIIFSGAGANSTNSRLVSTKGCVKATASQNTQSLRLGSGGGFFINVPDAATSPAPMKKFYAPKVTATDSTVVWALGNDVNDIPMQTIGTTIYHKAAPDSLKWLNVGVQDIPSSTVTAVTVSVSSTFNKSNTMMFISYDGSLTVGAMFEISPGLFRVNDIPVGKNVHLVGVSAINGQYYTAVQAATVATSSTPINLTMTAVSQSQMQTQINALP